MLVLSRKSGDRVYIGNDITVTILEIQGNRMKIGIDAPARQKVLRGELGDMQMAEPRSRERHITRREAWVGASRIAG